MLSILRSVPSDDPAFPIQIIESFGDSKTCELPCIGTHYTTSSHVGSALIRPPWKRVRREHVDVRLPATKRRPCRWLVLLHNAMYVRLRSLRRCEKLPQGARRTHCNG